MLKDLKIDKEAIDPDDPDMLQDLVIDAVNKGLAQIDEATQASLAIHERLDVIVISITAHLIDAYMKLPLVKRPPLDWLFTMDMPQEDVEDLLQH